MQYLLTPIFFLTIILSTITTIPIIVSMLLCFTVIFRSPWVFVAALFGGLLVDVFLLRTFGITSLFLVILTFMIFLYQRRFEIQTVPFVFIASFIGSFIYLKMFGYSQILVQALAASLLALFLFKILSRFSRVYHEL